MEVLLEDLEVLLVDQWQPQQYSRKYEGWNFNSGNYLFTTDTK